MSGECLGSSSAGRGDHGGRDGWRERSLSRRWDGRICRQTDRARVVGRCAARRRRHFSARPVPHPGESMASPEPAGEEPAPGRESVFDAEALLARVDGQLTRARRLVIIFLEDDLPLRLPALARAIDREDDERVSRGPCPQGSRGRNLRTGCHRRRERLGAAVATDPRQVRTKYETLEGEMHKLRESLRAFARL